MSLLLTLFKIVTRCSGVFIVVFEQVNARLRIDVTCPLTFFSLFLLLILSNFVAAMLDYLRQTSN